jgi:hypothetical protein
MPNVSDGAACHRHGDCKTKSFSITAVTASSVFPSEERHAVCFRQHGGEHPGCRQKLTQLLYIINKNHLNCLNQLSDSLFSIDVNPSERVASRLVLSVFSHFRDRNRTKISRPVAEPASTRSCSCYRVSSCHDSAPSPDRLCTSCSPARQSRTNRILWRRPD